MEVEDEDEEVVGVNENGIRKTDSNINLSQITVSSFSSAEVVLSSKEFETPPLPTLPKKRLIEVSEDEFHLCLPILYNERLKKYRQGESVTILEDIYNNAIIPMVEVQAVSLAPNQVALPSAPVIVKEAVEVNKCDVREENQYSDDDDDEDEEKGLKKGREPGKMPFLLSSLIWSQVR